MHYYNLIEMARDETGLKASKHRREALSREGRRAKLASKTQKTDYQSGFANDKLINMQIIVYILFS